MHYIHIARFILQKYVKVNVSAQTIVIVFKKLRQRPESSHFTKLFREQQL